MAKARKRFYEISPSWAGASEVGLETEGWFLAPLTTGMSFADIEQKIRSDDPNIWSVRIREASEGDTRFGSRNR